MPKSMTAILVAAAVFLLLGIVLLSAWLLTGDDSPVEPGAAAIPIASATAGADPAGESLAPATKPAPAVALLPSATPPPTDTPTVTPPPTETPPPTDTPPPTATNTPERIFVPPTNTPVPPTNTPPPTSPPPDSRGLTATHFGLQDRSVFAVDRPVWFEFTIANSAGGPVPYGSLGVMPKKDGTDRLDWYQHSYGGNDDEISPNGLTHEDHIDLPEAGNYTLRLVICFDARRDCVGGSGTFITLSQEIPVTIN